MSGFNADWLALREPADRHARDPQLAHDFIGALSAPGGAPRRLIDLGGGTGANLRILAPLIDGDQQWLLIDWDTHLLEHACKALGDWAQALGHRVSFQASYVDIQSPRGRWQIRTRRLDLAQSLESIELKNFDAVVTTAFLDLVSAPWLDRLAAWLAQTPRPLLATLTVDGRRQWYPTHLNDEFIQRAFRTHQAGDKGFGESLGPAAIDDLCARLSARGFQVRTAPSDWQLDGHSRQLLQTLLSDEAAVALEVHPEAQIAIREWLSVRSAQLELSELSLRVGHQDLLALPG
ncbi:MAG: hypothetical protein RI906_757 [Pseudomonadota bacterium]|jgi:hypothetical protein